MRTKKYFVMPAVAVCAALLILTGCKGEEETPPAAKAVPQSVSFKTSDGVEIHADLYKPAEGKGPAVILVPMLGKDRKSWALLVDDLVGGGFTVLALDVRGHGESTKKGGETLNYLSFGKQEWLAAVEDLKAARDYLVSKEGVEPRRIGIVGASIGCSLALEYARQELNLPVLVLLSPGTEYHDIDSLASARAYGSRAIMIVACAQDTKDDGNNQQAVAAKDLYDALGENAAKKINIFNEGDYHGTEMLGKTLDGKNVNGEIIAELNLLKQN